MHPAVNLPSSTSHPASPTPAAAVAAGGLCAVRTHSDRPASLVKHGIGIKGIFLAIMAASLSVAAAAISIVQEWYVPQPEAEIREDYLVLAPNTNTTTDSVIAVTVAIAGTKIVYDQWEDGYEVDITNPTQAATTQIWGDGNDANGKPPGYATDPASFPAGSLILMRNNVPLPRNAGTILFDGRDRIGSTFGIVMTREAWFTTPGPLLTNSVEVRSVPDWGTSFVLPVGEDVIFPTPLASSMFEHCSADIMAAANGTVVPLREAGEEKPRKLTRSSIGNIVFMEKTANKHFLN